MPSYDVISDDELEELKKWVPNVIEEFRRKGVTTIVGIDKSGRPPALLVWKTWKKLYPREDPKLFFINPSILEMYPVSLLVKQNILQKEQPHLYKIIKDEPSHIGIIDEYKATGRTLRRIS